MQSHHNPPLSFDLDVKSATDWLNRLPKGNIAECSRTLYPALQALNLRDMDPLLRLYILERCHPLVFRVSGGLEPLITDRHVPQDPKTRKLAVLACRIHMKTALGYGRLLEAVELTGLASRSERLLALRRALEHWACCLLRAAQAGELPPSATGPSLAALYAQAYAEGRLEETGPGEAGSAASIGSWFEQIALFRLAAPGRLPKEDVHRLFERLVLLNSAANSDLPQEARRGMAMFAHEAGTLAPLVPAWPDLAPPGSLPAFSAKGFCRQPHADRPVPETGLGDSLNRSLARLGERLPCPTESSGRLVGLSMGFASAAAMLGEIDARRLAADPGGGLRAGYKGLGLAPNEEDLEPSPFSPRRTEPTFAETVKAAEKAMDRRSLPVVPTELPGFYLVDSGRWLLRAGLLVGLNSDDIWVQLGVIRAGQVRDGRFWHSLELIGDRQRSVRASKIRMDRTEQCDAILVFLQGGETRLIVAPVNWRCGDSVNVFWQKQSETLRLTRVIETTPDFHEYAAVSVEPAEN